MYGVNSSLCRWDARVCAASCQTECVKHKQNLSGRTETLRGLVAPLTTYCPASVAIKDPRLLLLGMKACCRVLTSAIWSSTEINRSYARQISAFIQLILFMLCTFTETVWVFYFLFVFLIVLSSWCWVVSFWDCRCRDSDRNRMLGNYRPLTCKGLCLTFIKGEMAGERGMEGRRKALECDTGKMCSCWRVELFPLVHPYVHSPPSSHGCAVVLTSAVSWGSGDQSSKGLILVWMMNMGIGC